MGWTDRRSPVNETHIQFLSSPEWAQMLEVDLLPWIESVGDLGDEVLEVGPVRASPPISYACGSAH